MLGCLADTACACNGPEVIKMMIVQPFHRAVPLIITSRSQSDYILLLRIDPLYRCTCGNIRSSTLHPTKMHEMLGEWQSSTAEEAFHHNGWRHMVVVGFYCVCGHDAGARPRSLSAKTAQAFATRGFCMEHGLGRTGPLVQCRALLLRWSAIRLRV